MTDAFYLFALDIVPGVFVMLICYGYCIRHFSRTLQAENPELWHKLSLLQKDPERVNAAKIYRSFMARSMFTNQNIPKTMTAVRLAVAVNLAFGLLVTVLWWYYMLYLPYKK